MISSTVTFFLPILSLVISICVVFGGFIAFKSGFSKTSNEIQESVITALQALNQSQKEEIIQLRRVISTMQTLSKKRGMVFEINRDEITVIESSPQRTTSISIEETK